MTVLHGLLCINSAVACVAHTPIQMSRRSPIKASPACLAVKKEGKKKKGSVSIHLMNLYPLRWVHSLLQWNSVLITEQEGDGGKLRRHRYRDSRDGDRPVIHNKLLILRLERKTARECLIMWTAATREDLGAATRRLSEVDGAGREAARPFPLFFYLTASTPAASSYLRVGRGWRWKPPRPSSRSRIPPPAFKHSSGRYCSTLTSRLVFMSRWRLCDSHSSFIDQINLPRDRGDAHDDDTKA